MFLSRTASSDVMSDSLLSLKVILGYPPTPRFLCVAFVCVCGYAAAAAAIFLRGSQSTLKLYHAVSVENSDDSSVIGISVSGSDSL